MPRGAIKSFSSSSSNIGNSISSSIDSIRNILLLAIKAYSVGLPNVWYLYGINTLLSILIIFILCFIMPIFNMSLFDKSFTPNTNNIIIALIPFIYIINIYSIALNNLLYNKMLNDKYYLPFSIGYIIITSIIIFIVFKNLKDISKVIIPIVLLFLVITIMKLVIENINNYKVLNEVKTLFKSCTPNNYKDCTDKNKNLLLVINNSITETMNTYIQNNAGWNNIINLVNINKFFIVGQQIFGLVATSIFIIYYFTKTNKKFGI